MRTPDAWRGKNAQIWRLFLTAGIRQVIIMLELSGIGKGLDGCGWLWVRDLYMKNVGFAFAWASNRAYEYARYRGGSLRLIRATLFFAFRVTFGVGPPIAAESRSSIPRPAPASRFSNYFDPMPLPPPEVVPPAGPGRIPLSPELQSEGEE